MKKSVNYVTRIKCKPCARKNKEMKLHTSVIRDFFWEIITFIVVIFIKLFGRKCQNNEIQEIKNILFVRIDRIGDMLLTTPAIRAVKNTFKNANIYVLCTPYNKDVIANNKNISGAFIYGKNPLQHFELINDLRKYNFDIAIDTYSGFNIKSALLTYLSNAKIRLGYYSKHSEHFFNRIRKISNNKYEVLKHLELLKTINIYNNDIKLELNYSLKNEKKAKDFLLPITHGNKYKLIIGINIGARRNTHLWQPEKFAQLADFLINKHNVEVVITWGPNEMKLVDNIRNKMKKKVNVAYQTNVLELAALISKFNLFLCSDTGPFHIAVSQNVPVVVLFGKGDCVRWSPPDSTNIRIIDGKKLKNISVEEVKKEIYNLLKI